MRSWLPIILLISVSLTGCGWNNHSTNVSTVVEKPRDIDPQWPRLPAKCPVPKYEMTTTSKGVAVAIPYQEYLNSRVCERDRIRYISNLTSVTCFYRQPLGEPICDYYYPKETK